MKKEIHLGNSGIYHILFLPEDATATKIIVMHVMNSLDKHTTRTTSGIINSLTRLRVKDTDKKRNDRPGSIELAGLRFTIVSEPLKEYFISIAHQISRIILIP